MKIIILVMILFLLLSGILEILSGYFIIRMTTRTNNLIDIFFNRKKSGSMDIPDDGENKHQVRHTKQLGVWIFNKITTGLIMTIGALYILISMLNKSAAG